MHVRCSRGDACRSLTPNGSNLPTLKLMVGGTELLASYLSGSGTRELVFQASIATGLNDTSGVAIAANALSLPAGSLLQDDAGNNAALAHASVSANSSFKVDTTAPLAPVVQTKASVDGGVTASDASDAGGIYTVSAEAGTSVALRLTLGSAQATLTEEQIETTVAAIVAQLASRLGARQRA